MGRFHSPTLPSLFISRRDVLLPHALFGGFSIIFSSHAESWWVRIQPLEFSAGSVYFPLPIVVYVYVLSQARLEDLFTFPFQTVYVSRGFIVEERAVVFSVFCWLWVQLRFGGCICHY